MLTTGAEPLFLLDYVAANRIELEQVAELVEGAAEVCRAAGCALIGGETAELPGHLPRRRARLRRDVRRPRRARRLVDGSRVEAGDAVVGFPSAGVHANGFTLVRAARSRTTTTTATTCSRRRGSTSTRCARSARAPGALAHVTGGGILGNLSRVLPDGLSAELDWDAWQRPPVFEWLAEHVDEEELRRVFNLGIGYLRRVPGSRRAGRARDRADRPRDRRARQRARGRTCRR